MHVWSEGDVSCGSMFVEVCSVYVHDLNDGALFALNQQPRVIFVRFLMRGFVFYWVCIVGLLWQQENSQSTELLSTPQAWTYF